MKFVLLVCSFLSLTQLKAAPIPGGERILEITVNQDGLITAVGDTVSEDNLAHYIQQRLFKAWLENRQMYTRIKFTRKGEVSETVAGNILKEIKDGQEQGLTAICLEKFRTRFENLDPKKQANLRKKLPVLFQTDYS